MIEIVNKNERNMATQFLHDDSDLCPDNVKFCMENSDKVIAYYDDSSNIVGCGTFRLWGKERNRADVYLYVVPGERHKGVGSSLLKSLLNTSEGMRLQYLSTRIETNHLQTLDFFHKAGFETWYTELILSHSGKRQPECNLEFVNYQSEYFEQYVDTLRNSFWVLRSSNDFQPYYCCEPDEAKRDELERNKDNIFVLMDGEKLAASVIINKENIEDVFVAPAYQGKGIGRQMLHFAVNKAIDRGDGHIALSAIEWNTRALTLYESVGFQLKKTIHYMRLFL